MPTPRLTPELIAAAVEGYESQKARIDQKIAELRAILSGGPAESAATPEASARKRRKMSAAGRKAIAEAQRKRWAEARKAAEPAPQEAAKPKRRIGKEGMKRIIAATKKRWAAVRAAKAQQEKAPAKKAAKKSAAKRRKEGPGSRAGGDGSCRVDSTHGVRPPGGRVISKNRASLCGLAHGDWGPAELPLRCRNGDTGDKATGRLLKRSFWQSLIAVLAGNAIYFSVERFLPARAQHQVFQIDFGLAVDFWICLACYGLVRLIR